MKYIAIIDADEKPVSCEFIGCNGNAAPYLIGATTNIKLLEQEHCGDCISRQAMKNLGAECIAKRDENGNLIPLGSIDSLPPVDDAIRIVRCGQCKYAKVADSEDSQDGYTCQFHQGSI